MCSSDLIDPADVGRSYDPIIRINSQSGKGGIAYILEHNYGLIVPKSMQQEFSLIVTKVSDAENRELSPEEIYALFMDNYKDIKKPVEIVYYNESTQGKTVTVTSDVVIDGKSKQIVESGNGILDAFCKSLQKELGIKFDVVNYSEHSLSFGNKSRAITYIQIYDKDHNSYFGAGTSSNISKSSLRAVFSAVNKMRKG